MGKTTEVWCGVCWDRRLSFESLYIIIYLLSQDDEYDFTIDSLCKELNATKHEITKAVRQLKKYGYIQDYNGGHIIHEIPQITNPKFSRNPNLIKKH